MTSNSVFFFSFFLGGGGYYLHQFHYAGSDESTGGCRNYQASTILHLQEASSRVGSVD